MARVLSHTVLVGGVVYPAGTPQGDVDGEVPAKFWQGGEEPVDDRITGDYADRTARALSGEIDARNADRDPEGETYIKPDGKNKDDLIAALEADDQRS